MNMSLAKSLGLVSVQLARYVNVSIESAKMIKRLHEKITKNRYDTIMICHTSNRPFPQLFCENTLQLQCLQTTNRELKQLRRRRTATRTSLNNSF